MSHESMSHQAAFRVLTDFFLELGLEPSALAPLLDKAQLKSCQPGEVLLAQGGKQQSGFLLLNGLLRACHYLSDGQQRCKEFYFPGEFCLLYSSFLSAEPARYQLEALENSTLVVVPLSLFELGGFQRAELSLLRAQLRYKEQKEAFLLLKLPEQRYLWLKNHCPHWISALSQVQLANYIGITPESLSRIRRRLNLS
ncbi:MAG: Crp/Fnr family transcriptional regulator [Shewanella algae]